MLQRDVRLEELPSSKAGPEASTLEVSVVMPCLNEAETLATCIEKAQRALQENDITGEVIVADNGSTDGSQIIAGRKGARVVHVEAKGYGNALMGGIAASHGKFIIMGDADDSYDFLEIPRFVEIVAPLAARARATLADLGYRNVEVRSGNGYLGWPEHAPYDRIIVTAAPLEVPPALVDQLRVGGVMAIPVGPVDGNQELRILERTATGLELRRTLPVRFVPMTGKP